MTHLNPLTQNPKAAETVPRVMLETKIQLMEEYTFLKEIFGSSAFSGKRFPYP